VSATTLEATASVPAPEPPRWWVDAILHGYGQIVLAPSRAAGIGLLTASFAEPRVGLAGLATSGLAVLLAHGLGYDREQLRSGALGANAALCGLWLGVFAGAHEIGLLIPAVAAALVVVQPAVTALFSRFLLPALSTPFVLVAAALHAALGLGARATTAPFDPLDALSALVFGSGPLAGVVVAAAIIAWSRVAAVHAAVGLAVAAAAVSVGGGPAPIVGFNAVVVAIGLGGVFYVPGTASLALAAAGAAAAAALTTSMHPALSAMGLPVLAAPLNVVMGATLLGLAQRGLPRGPRPVSVPRPTPEASLSYDRTRVRRFQLDMPVRLRLPFRGAWVCTQGNDGAHTHQGPWRHGLDFEIADTSGRRHQGDGSRVDDWYCYRQPVASMAEGTVVGVVDGVPDNAVGTLNVERNWGNLVVIRHAPDRFAVYAHLSPGSIRVVEGEVVRVGQIVGLCGNSGRSPNPHLHIQLQATPRVGDPTCPIALHDVVVDGTAVAELVPTLGQVVRNAGYDEVAARELAFPIGTDWRLAVTRGDVTAVHRVRSEIDALGSRSLVDVDTGARLWFDAGPEGFVAYDVLAPPDHGLCAVYAALARYRCDETDLAWSDWLDPARLSSGLFPFLADALGAVIEVRPQPVAYQSTRSGDVRRVRGRAPATRPWHVDVETEATLRNGGVDVMLRRGERALLATLERA
jgi:murein DD-endopeptidase MepM/ murein hydrolase activator NlpD